jgi:thymidylate synthase ThyX
MSVKSELIAYSQSAVDGTKLATFKIEVPLAAFIDIATHRIFSKNASSSRAIPTKKWRQRTLDDIAIPTILTKFSKGMSANEPLDEEVAKVVKSHWIEAAEFCASKHKDLEDLGVSKQDANVLLYQFSHLQVIISSTFWDNFFNLRCDNAAKPDVRILAEMMKDALTSTTPTVLKHGDWHLPLVTEEEKLKVNTKDLIKVSVARCARVSYIIPETGLVSTIDKDIELHNRLISSNHGSPLEHIATPFAEPNIFCGNYLGWLQYRKLKEPNNTLELPSNVKYISSAEAKNKLLFSLD